MTRYTVRKEGSPWWQEVDATSEEMAYRATCCWFYAETRIIVTNTETGEAKVFTRMLDKDGNLVDIRRENA